MSNNGIPMMQAQHAIDETITKFIMALCDTDEEMAHEVISVMLMQGLSAENSAIRPFFPVWHAIRQHIDDADMQRAPSQSKTWQAQIHKVIRILENS